MILMCMPLFTHACSIKQLSDGEDEKKANEDVISEQPHNFHVDDPDHKFDEDSRMESPVANGTTTNDPIEGLTFDQEQTADELLADIQNAVDEMLHDFQASPVTTNPPPVAPKTKRSGGRGPQKDSPPPETSGRTLDHTICMRSKNGGFGFQIMGGVDSDLLAQVDYIVPGKVQRAVQKSCRATGHVGLHGTTRNSLRCFLLC